MSSVAIIGLRHGERHVHGFLSAGAQKVYAVDINKDLYENVLHDRVEVSDDYRAVLPLADMIVISLPPILHKEALQEAIKTKASRIWIEKPLLNIGESPHTLTPDARVEIIHELRRNKLVRDWLEGDEKCQEAWLNWSRPVPSQYKPDRYPIGVVHDLGSHLIDLSFALLKEQPQIPVLEKAKLVASTNGDAQRVDFTLKFGDVPVHLRAAWVDDKDWPDKEITVQINASSGDISWASQKSTHRHLTKDGIAPTKKQIGQEKDWYAAALQGDPTCFTPLNTAIMVQTICNDIVRTLQEEVS